MPCTQRTCPPAAMILLVSLGSSGLWSSLRAMATTFCPLKRPPWHSTWLGLGLGLGSGLGLGLGSRLGVE